MRRFNYEENDEYREDVEKFFSEDEDVADLSDEEYKAIMQEEQAIQHIQLNFVQRDLNHRMLKSAIRTCEKWFWWRFCSQNTRLKMIQETYDQFRMLEDDIVLPEDDIDKK